MTMKRAGTAELAVGAVHEGTNDGVGDGIEQAQHAGDHHRSKQHASGASTLLPKVAM